MVKGRQDVAADVELTADDEKLLKALRTALIEGEESGKSASFDGDAFLAEMRARNAAKG